MKRLFTLLALSSGVLLADGGEVQFRGPAGPFDITVFASPTPLRIGTSDLSVMVKTKSGDTPVLDADVTLHLVKAAEGKIIEVTARPNHQLATNKLLYATHMRIPSNGPWRVDVLVKQGTNVAELSGRIFVLPPQPPLAKYWGYFALVPLLALLFAINQRLKRQRRNRRLPARR